MGNSPKILWKETFMEAWDDMYQYVKQRLADATMTYQELETAIWIDVENGPPIFFYDARDRAINSGWVPPA